MNMAQPHRSDSNRLHLGVTSLSQYIRNNNCQRFLRFRLCPDEQKAMEERWGITVQPLTPLLREEGLSFETKVTSSLKGQGELVVDIPEHADASATLEWMQKVREPVVLLQPPIAGSLGRYDYNGRADVLRLWREGDDLHAYIADIKASRKEHSEHRIQIAAYACLLRQMAESAGLHLAGIRGGVMHIQPDGSLPKLDPNDGFDLAAYETSLRQLAVDDDCTLNQVAGMPFADVPYHLGYHCDGCLYNALCMYDSAERQDISLTPGITAAEKRVLQQHGVRTLPQLAQLMDYSADGRSLEPAPAHASQYQELANTWGVNVTLPLLVQRARAALHRRDRAIGSRLYLLGNGYPTLPDDGTNEGLVKIFFDAQHDYLANRVYLLAALVAGPKGKRVVVRGADEPPAHDSECSLLTGWIAGVLRAVSDYAAGPQAPVHLYCYNPYDQRVLLDALKRHLGEVAQLPGFFDLMTQHPALDQPIITFLAREVEAQDNLGLVCQPLHEVASNLYVNNQRFDWTYDGVEFYRLFRARLFDNRRDVILGPSGTLQPAPDSIPRGDPRRFTVESASRFNSQIPLEYIYGAWRRLPAGKDGRERALLAPFRQITKEQIGLFAAHRVRALAHIEASFRFKNRLAGKSPLNLTRLTTVPEPPSLAQSLREFLYMEHHASRQAHEQTYALPIERRMQTGLALLLRFVAKDSARDVYRFDVAFEAAGLDAAAVMNGLRLKEGAWVVVNTVDPPTSAAKIKNGKLGIVQAVGETWVEISLKPLTFKTSFKYLHNTRLEPAAGQLYTLDEMADDLNADKQVEALANTGSNTLYGWLSALPPLRAVPAALQDQSQRFLEAVNELERPNRMTTVQKRIVGGRLDAPLLLVQGPPGTGKSHTIGWAVLNRMLLAAAAGKPCRVAVASHTHNAVNIVLESIQKKWRKLAAAQLRGIGLDAMFALPVVKLGGEDGDEPPPGVRLIDPFRRKTDLDDLLNQSFVVIGGTPGYLFNLARYRSLGGANKVDWEAKPFDLLVIDEASQMSVPEAVLAGAFLHTDGSTLVVGDHRQMPPIIQHEWEKEEKRSVMAGQPFLSLFEFLIDRGFPKESLDQSFRLHHTIATFLQQNVYVRDGIRFFSRRSDLLDRPFPVSPYVDAVMDPHYPIVVVEHGEMGSHQYNAAELALAEPLIRCTQDLRLDGSDGVGVVVPHRAQKALLRTRFPTLAGVDAIDTVERFQGGERDVIIVSATASDPDYVLAEADFLLNLNRLNVALSRPRKKLVVVASRSVTRLLLSNLAVFDNAVIWKRLYFQYANQVLWEGTVNGVPVTVRGAHADGSTSPLR